MRVREVAITLLDGSGFGYRLAMPNRPGVRRVFEEQQRACGRVPRVSRLMALALKLETLLAQGTLRNPAELAELGHVSRPRPVPDPAAHEPGTRHPRGGAVSSQNRARPRSHDRTPTGPHRAPAGLGRAMRAFSVLCWPPQHADDSEFQGIDALAVALKGAHLPALVGQVARDEATHRMGLPAS